MQQVVLCRTELYKINLHCTLRVVSELHATVVSESWEMGLNKNQ